MVVAGVGGVLWGGESVFNGYSISVLQDETSYGDGQGWWFHNNVNVFNTTVLRIMVTVIIVMCILPPSSSLSPPQQVLLCPCAHLQCLLFAGHNEIPKANLHTFPGSTPWHKTEKDCVFAIAQIWQEGWASVQWLYMKLYTQLWPFKGTEK